MAFTVGNRVRVADQSSEFRRQKGTVQDVLTSPYYNVRLDGQRCGGLTLLRIDQLKADATPQTIDYGQCTG